MSSQSIVVPPSFTILLQCPSPFQYEKKNQYTSPLAAEIEVSRKAKIRNKSNM